MLKSGLLFVLLAITLLCAALFAPQLPPESWADERLPVRDGLALWLDATRQATAAKVNNQPSPASGQKLGLWYDGSGLARHFRQADAAAQPKLKGVYPSWVVNLDGNGTYLSAALPLWNLKQATIFVYARMSPNGGNIGNLMLTNDSIQKQDGFSLYAKKLTGTTHTISTAGVGFERPNSVGNETVNVGDKFCATLSIKADNVQLYLGGNLQESRRRSAGVMAAVNQLLVGKEGSGAFQGDIFEMLVYDRALTDAERKSVEGYLSAKYAAVVYVAEAKSTAQAGSIPLETIKNPPVIQPLVPGFVSKKLPVQLSNINVLRYRPDGRLYAGAYDGKIYLLRDTDGDGLEDKSSLYWESEDLKVITALLLTPPNYPKGEGVFVATRGRILLILDKDKDNRGDSVVTVAEGWTPPERFAGGVSDALGLAISADNRLFFGLGTSDFTNAYLLDARTGKARYKPESERGTIQEVSADFSQRKTVCTGVRYSVGMAFNKQGDLFVTEQEGATWLANGNPYDELLHIQLGRHYGFPPRHPEHLPNVVDEPSTFDYGPQHQSTVGLCFNEPLTEGGPVFGPRWWQGDALVAAMSRGKIYRTKLVKTPVGYVAKNETIAQLSRIIIDQAVSPQGHLTVTLHSGQSDWGTGPTGAGELWKLVPLPTAVPQPVLTWSASPTEVRVAFDSPLSAQHLASLQGKVRLVEGRYVQVGDRFEVMRPGYQAVKNQLATPRFPVAITKLALADEGRTLVITTPARSKASQYGLTIDADLFNTGGGPYGGQMDLLTDLTGVEAEWKPANGAGVKSWIPHPNFAVSRELTTASAAHQPFWNSVSKAGTVTIRGQLDLGQMLYAEVQAGSKLDWQYPTEQVTVVFGAARPFQIQVNNQSIKTQSKDGAYEATYTLPTQKGTWLAYQMTVEPGTGDPALQTSWFTDRSAVRRPFALRRVLVPYAKPLDADVTAHDVAIPQLAGGNWAKGKTLFYGQAACSTCHTMRGVGGKIGPDLTNLIYRDYASVLRDIQEPNAAINPEHVAYEVNRKNATSLTGVLLAENANSVSFGLIGGEVTDIPRGDIASLKQLAVSLMPAGLDKSLSPMQLRDLMTYLLKAPAETKNTPVKPSGATTAKGSRR